MTSSFVSSIIPAIGLTVFIGLVLFVLAICVFFLIVECKLFIKCGYPWWMAIIPFYSKYIFLFKICGLHWAWFAGWFAATTFLFVKKQPISVLDLFINAIAFYNLAIRFDRDKTASMIFGAVFPGIVMAVYAFGKNEYDGSIPVKESGLF